MNIDFSQDATFSAYVVALLFSGLALLIASAAAKDRTRWLDLLFGVGFLGYGFYLGFLFEGGSYQMFFYAFIVPIVMIVRTIKERMAAPPASEQTDPVAPETVAAPAAAAPETVAAPAPAVPVEE